MKWIKVAIGALITVISIGIITTTVYKMTQPREVLREVSFEIDYDEGKYYPTSIYNEILEYGVINEVSGYIVNLLSIYINNEISDIFINISSNRISIAGDLPDLSGIIESYITPDGSWYDDGGNLDYDITVKLVFEVTQPPQLTGTNATLILLIPVVFVGGVVLYIYKPFKRRDK